MTTATGCGHRESDARTDQAPPPVKVTAAPVKFQPVQRTVEAVGTLYGFEEVTLSTKVEGRVLEIFHEVSDRVKPGEPLLKIDPTDYRLAVRQAEKTLQVELAKLGLDKPPGPGFDVSLIPSVVQASARMENAKSVLGRMRSAVEGVSREELAEKATNFRVAQAEYNNQTMTARAGLTTIQMKQEALAIAQKELDDTVVCAPVPTVPVPGAGSGVTYAVTQRAVAEGTYVKSGIEVFRLAIDQTLKLRAPVPERYGADLRVGQKADVFTAAYAEPFSGTLKRINPAVDLASRTFEVEIQVPNNKGQLKPGSFAKTAILTRLEPEAATVPLEALVTFAGITKIFLVENKQAREVPVTLGVQGTEWVEIVSPVLPHGGRVVTSGQTAIADGTAVEERSAPEAASNSTESAAQNVKP